MASQATQNSSFIHLPVESSPTHVTDFYMKEFLGAENLPSARNKGNGSVKVETNESTNSPKVPKGKGFDTFLMTGEMIIHTNPAVTPKLVREEPTGKTVKESNIPRLQQKDQKQQQLNKPHPQQGVPGSPKLHSKIPSLIKVHNSQHPPSSSSSYSHSESQNISPSAGVNVFPRIQAPVAEQEELSDLSQSSCSESELGLENSSGTLTPSASLPAIHHCESSSAPSALNLCRLEQAMENLGQLQSTLPGNNTFGLSDTSFSEPPSSGDSGFVYDGHTSDSDMAERVLSSSENTLLKERNFASDETLMERDVSTAGNVTSCTENSTKNQEVVSEISGEKFNVHGGHAERLLVRTSKSHENYLQASTGASLVNIDIDDNLAYSLDTLAYHDSQDSSLDSVTSEPVQVSRSLDNSPEKKSEKSSAVEREFIPGFISFDDPKSVKLKSDKQREETDVDKPLHLNSASPPSQRLQFISRNNSKNTATDGVSLGQTQDESDEDSRKLSLMSDEAELDNIYHQPSKAVDRPSAERLAKRLFHLEGFKKSDVARHLCKKNDFSNLVAEEYLKFFDFQDDTLDQALRKFLLRFSLYGETQERERVLAHFSHRFMECNEGSFNSEDACHTLTCAIMLLNSDLHSPNVGRRMTCQEFIDNLAELNDGEDFSKEVLKAIYQSIKNEPLEWAVDEASPEKEGSQLLDQSGQRQMSIPSSLGSNPFLEIPDPNKTTEYKKGYVMRKCCVDSDRRKTPFGKRGWKMMYAVLRDMILYQYKDEHQLKRGHFVESAHNAIRIHHALATKATDYTKKQHVFRLQTADGAEFLFQTGDSKELQEWIDTINLVAASLSAPVLPGAVGSRTKFQRQLLPSSYTRLNLKEQLHSHEMKVQELEQELLSHRATAPEKGTKSSIIQEYLDKENYLEFEIKRFKTYFYLLQSKLMSIPVLEPSLVETTIGEYEEMGAVPTMGIPHQTTVVVNVGQLATSARTVQRSLSDRYSYRAAIYQTDCVEYDMV